MNGISGILMSITPEVLLIIIVEKQRNGPIGEGKLRFLTRTVKFADYEVERVG